MQTQIINDTVFYNIFYCWIPWMTKIGKLTFSVIWREVQFDQRVRTPISYNAKRQLNTFTRHAFLLSKNITRFTLLIYLFTLEFIYFICKSFVSNSLKSCFFHCAFFSITSFLLQHLHFLLLLFFFNFFAQLLASFQQLCLLPHLLFHFAPVWQRQQVVATVQNVTFPAGFDTLGKLLRKP